MTLSILEQAATHAAYIRLGSIRKAGALLGYSPNTIKKYVLQEYTVVHEQVRVTKVQSTDQRLIGLYVGLWMGDGTQYRDGHMYTVKICSNKYNKALNMFIHDSLVKLFGVNVHVLEEANNGRCYIKVHSRFVFEFINEYCVWEENKTHSVRLKHSVQKYSKEFREGCFLGLMLSDGHIKKAFAFNVTSTRLVKNMIQLLELMNIPSKVYVQKRVHLGWRDLHCLRILKRDIVQALQVLDSCLQQLGYKEGFLILKNEPAVI